MNLKSVKTYLFSLVFALVMILGFSTNAFAISQSEADASPEIKLNEIKTDSLEKPESEHWYKFTITEPGYFRISLGPNSAAKTDDLGWGWKYYIYKKGDLTATIGDDERITTTQKSNWFAFSPDTFYIRVVNSSDNKFFATDNQPFDIKVEFNKSDVWESEDNNKNNVANTIKVNTTYSGNLYYGEDIDWFKYTAPDDGIHSFTMAPDVNESDSEKLKWGWNYTVYKAGSMTEVYSEDGITKNTKSTQFKLKKGTYYIKIQAKAKGDYFSPTGQVYNFSVKFMDYGQFLSKSSIKQLKPTIAPKKVTVKWKKNEYAAGYEIYRSTKAKKGFKKIGTVTSAKKTSFIDKKAKSKKVYFYKVRGYVKVNGKKVYSKYSTVKKVKTK